MKKTIQAPDLVVLWTLLKESGDENVLKQLMDAMYGTLYNYGRKFTKDDAFIKDCIQDVFINLWQYRTSLTVPDSPKAYLLTSLRRKMVNNGSKGAWVTLEGQPEEVFAHYSTPESLVSQQEAIREQMHLIAELLEKLSGRQREAIYLRYYQGLTRPEIAAVMNISEQSVSNILQKAIHSLRKAYPANLSLLATLLSCLLQAP